ncbi:MAG TPA: amino acid ABC transporter ATP-binding protein [Terriglobia bacterium]|nr:amino acid ABC transporter ATP-binding protein [Terriglobia bacterium]
MRYNKLGLRLPGHRSIRDAMDEIIEVGQLYKLFGGVPALRGVSFTVSKSQLTVIIGPSGCGKSTLLRCLNGLETFDSGRVRIGNITLERHNESQNPGLNHNGLRELRKEVGIVFQGFNLFPHLTVLGNAVKSPMVVKGVSRKEAEDRAMELLAKVGLEDRAQYYPSQLSGGQQQRAAIARALAMSPKVMLYDEPTSALDPSLVNEVLQIMRKLDDEGMTQVVVTHEMRFAREAADNILFLDEGEIVESGPAEALFTSPRDARTRQFLRNFV